MKKNLFLLFLVISISLLFVACGGSSGGSGSSTNAVDYYSDLADDGPIVEQISEEMEEKIDLSIKFTGYSDGQAYQTAVSQSLGKADSPGIFKWWSGYRLNNLAATGEIADLTDEWEDYYVDAGINPELAEAFTVDGKVYGAPLSVLYNVVFYNKNVFDEYNLSPPETFDDFLEIAETLKNEGVIPLAVKNDGWASFVWLQLFLGAYDPDLYTDLVEGNVSYEDDQVVEALSVWQSMIEAGYFGEPVKAENQTRQFAKGDAAMAYEPPIFIKGLEDDYGMEANEDYGMFVIPSMDDSTKPVIFYEASPLVVSEASSQKEDAKKVLREIETKDSFEIYAKESKAAFVEGVKTGNEISDEINEVANSDDYILKLRYYEATPSNIVDTATENLWEFFYNPSEKSLRNALANIQKVADEEEF
ncbi:ABC transporter substrate-binding protein [Gracilibacillus alcaliphilus]|uniref:ABC transporter substrate-binding protein n=1 Tax=Gracilibacillus alcaliphilus TaxID=1401441 RepID=UPI00195C17CD|nr:extracellular solute-binding protein [Gracilibacillus alcaliphilus]MBM7677716.1 multiple sugar transport system substrate-binding protein [Gracilibacillus alcaliphilus]